MESSRLMASRAGQRLESAIVAVPRGEIEEGISGLRSGGRFTFWIRETSGRSESKKAVFHVIAVLHFVGDLPALAPQPMNSRGILQGNARYNRGRHTLRTGRELKHD